jgi:hypothetical protein
LIERILVDFDEILLRRHLTLLLCDRHR